MTGVELVTGICFKCWIVTFSDLTLCQALSCVPVCLKLSVMGRSIVLCLLHHAPRVTVNRPSLVAQCRVASPVSCNEIQACIPKSNCLISQPKHMMSPLEVKERHALKLTDH